jgi:hypothetical protein
MSFFFLGNFIHNLPEVPPTKFQLIWPNGFREDFFIIGLAELKKNPLKPLG